MVRSGNLEDFQNNIWFLVNYELRMSNDEFQCRITNFNVELRMSNYEVQCRISMSNDEFRITNFNVEC